MTLRSSASRRLLTTLFYLNPGWVPQHGGRFMPWPCSDQGAAEHARASSLPSTEITLGELPEEALAQIPMAARDKIRLSISRKQAPTAEYENVMAVGRARQVRLASSPAGTDLL